ncbi:hypothetical protein NE850_18670 [Paraburkholderia sp. USG1]|uniref:hypothetical protein n=1 Tax=Paraburkholderia sp. USG1 TaxID=2952268 RepID=UPI002863A5EB|nr:hypothetical protein [Paraburkholderia sp. USG1]MDR8398369.1 hypothetical protein [Paraburkholderia sp. USG1]
MSEERINILLELYKANTLFFGQVAALAHQAGQQWQSESQRAIATAVAESGAELKELLEAKDLPALLASQTGIASRRWEKYQGSVQAALLASAGSPDAVVRKLAEAFGDWQRRVSEVTGTAVPAAGVWFGYPNPFQQFWSNVADGNGAKEGHGAK